MKNFFLKNKIATFVLILVLTGVIVLAVTTFAGGTGSLKKITGGVFKDPTKLITNTTNSYSTPIESVTNVCPSGYTILGQDCYQNKYMYGTIGKKTGSLVCPVGYVPANPKENKTINMCQLSGTQKIVKVEYKKSYSCKIGKLEPVYEKKTLVRYTCNNPTTYYSCASGYRIKYYNGKPSSCELIPQKKK